MATVFWAVRQKSTGMYLPEVHRSYTHVKPQHLEDYPPRLHCSPDRAARAMRSYVAGIHVNKYIARDTLEGREEYYEVQIMSQANRQPDDFEVVPMELKVNLAIKEKGRKLKSPWINEYIKTYYTVDTD